MSSLLLNFSAKLPKSTLKSPFPKSTSISLTSSICSTSSCSFAACTPGSSARFRFRDTLVACSSCLSSFSLTTTISSSAASLAA